LQSLSRAVEFRLKLIELAVEIQAWALARPEHETRKATGELEQEMHAITAIEQDQGIF
jgi:hypothetical protein